MLCRLWGWGALLIQQLFVITLGKKPKNARVFVSNHTAINDDLIGSATHPGNPVTKASLAEFWPFRQLFRLYRNLVVMRDDVKPSKLLKGLAKP